MKILSVVGVLLQTTEEQTNGAIDRRTDKRTDGQI